MPQTFSFTGARRIVFGCGSFGNLKNHIAEFRASRPLVVLDGGLAAAGMGETVAGSLGAAGMKCTLFDKIAGEPRLEQADEGARLARRKKADLVVGIGGGSAMDCAKAVAALAPYEARAADYLGLDRVPGPGLPTIMVPTTAGTGSEVTFTAVFIRRDLKKKEGMNSPYLYPEVALLDPLLTVSLPPAATAATGIDALCHAIESFTSVSASPMSELISLEAITLIAEHLRTCVFHGTDETARERMLLASLYAGLGLANAGVTAVHSLSYPLGGRYGISHGLANTLLLPAVMNYNLPGAVDKFAMIAEAMGEETEGLSRRDAACLAVEAVETLITDCGLPTSLAGMGIGEDDIPALAEQALTVARPLANNPRPVTMDDACAIYREAW